jgi:hypothetical protein
MHAHGVANQSHGLGCDDAKTEVQAIYLAIKLRVFMAFHRIVQLGDMLTPWRD